MRYLILVYLIFSLLVTVVPAEVVGPTEDPIRVGVGARHMGTGKAFVGLSDSSAVFFNPAGLAEISDWEFLSMNANVLNDVNYLTLGYVSPLKFRGIDGGWGIAYVGSGVSGIPSLVTSTSFAYSNYFNNVYLLTLAGKINNHLSMGFNYKLFGEGFSGAISSSGTGMDLDLGIKYKYAHWASFGLNLQNALPASLGGQVDWGDSQESLPAILKIGAAFRFLDKRLALAIDNDMWVSRSLPSQLHAGLEFDINPRLVLRGGVDQSLSSAVSGGVASNPTFGVGLRFWNVRFDYAYHPYFGESGALTHYFSLSLSPAIFNRTNILAAVMEKEKQIVKPPSSASLAEKRTLAVDQSDDEFLSSVDDLLVGVMAVSPELPKPVSKSRPKPKPIPRPSEPKVHQKIVQEPTVVKPMETEPEGEKEIPPQKPLGEESEPVGVDGVGVNEAQAELKLGRKKLIIFASFIAAAATSLVYKFFSKK